MQVVMAYDAFGQTTRQSEASETGGIGRITDRVYDRAGRLTRLTAYTDSSGGTGVQHTDYLYNKAGVMTARRSRTTPWATAATWSSPLIVPCA